MGTDLVVIGMLAVTLVGLGLRATRQPRGRLADGVKPRSVPVLVIVAAIFGALALAMIVYGALALRAPMELVDVRWMGLAELRMHAWPLAVAAIAFGLLTLIVPVALLAKLRVVLREGGAGPAAGDDEPSAFDRSSLARAVAPPTTSRATASGSPAAVAPARPARSAEQVRRDTLAALDRLDSAPDALAFLAAAARDVGPHVEAGPHAAALRSLLDDLDAARFGGAAADPAALAARLRALLA